MAKMKTTSPPKRKERGIVLNLEPVKQRLPFAGKGRATVYDNTKGRKKDKLRSELET